MLAMYAVIGPLNCETRSPKVGCEMDAIMAISRKDGLLVIEDGAGGSMSTYKGWALGTIGHLGVLSFHETKSIISDKGGALQINDMTLAERAEIVREKGTNRARFFRGQGDKSIWVDIRSAYLPSEVIAASPWAQMRAGRGHHVQATGHMELLPPLVCRSQREKLRPIVPANGGHNADMHSLLLPSLARRSEFIASPKEHDIPPVFHYVQLDRCPYRQRVGRARGDLTYTGNLWQRLVRLPPWNGLEEHQPSVVEAAISAEILEQAS